MIRILFCLSLLPTIAFGKTIADHTIELNHTDKLSHSILKFNLVTDNGETNPGIYIIGSHDGQMEDNFSNYEPKPKWLTQDASYDQKKEIMAEIQQEISDHPHRILMTPAQGQLGSQLLIEFLENANDSYQLSYDNKARYNKFSNRFVDSASAEENGKPARAEYSQLEKVIPDTDIKITNKKTGKTEYLSSLVDHLIELKKGNRPSRGLASVSEPGLGAPAKAVEDNVAGKDTAIFGEPTKDVKQALPQQDPWLVHGYEEVPVVDPNTDVH